MTSFTEILQRKTCLNKRLRGTGIRKLQNCKLVL